jgi:hypothetical protein
VQTSFDDVDRLITRAQGRLDTRGRNGVDDFTPTIDPNIANFRFDANGRVIGWFDPVGVVPPNRTFVGKRPR